MYDELTSRVGGLLANAKDDELGGLQRRYADQADHATVVEVVLGHRAAVATNEERFLGIRSQQRPGNPFVVEKVRDRLTDVIPQSGAIRFEYERLSGTVDRSFEVNQIAPHIDILPFRIGTDGARPSDSEAAASEVPQAVDAQRIQ